MRHAAHPAALALAVLALLTSAVATAEPLAVATGPTGPTSATAPKRNWGPEQATGAPDTSTAADAVTAWASWRADAPGEWLEVEFAREVEIAEIDIHESFNPGAISRVSVVGPNRDGVVDTPPGWRPTGPPETPSARSSILFSGTYVARSGVNVMVVKPSDHPRGRFVRIDLLSEKVPGWNEIDAVQLVGTDGSKQWAVGARASTSYADGAPPDPFQALIGHRAVVHLANGSTLDGVVESMGAEWVRVMVGGQGLVVLKTSVLYFEPK